MKRTPAAEEALKTPPSCLAGFDLVPLPLAEGGLDLAVDFALVCKGCAGRTFQILGRPSIDETFFAPPLRLKCAQCGSVAPLFDGSTQGYDGVLNGGCVYERGGSNEAPVPGQFHVTVGVLYNIELDELNELSKEANVSASDLFDAIDIVANPVGGGDAISFAYECA